jgi:hypothetical protein
MMGPAHAHPHLVDAFPVASDAPRAREDGRIPLSGDRGGTALARAFLALCDEPEALPRPRSLRRALAAASAALVLAVAGPLAWASAAPDPPVAAQKAVAPSPQADDEADGPSA